MTEKPLTLEDLTKEEILSIIHQYFFEVPRHHIIEARWHSLTQQAKAIMDEAQEKSQANIGGGIENVRRFQEASKEFHRGMALSDKADKLFEELRVTK